MSRKTTTLRIIVLLAFGLYVLYLAFTVEAYKPLGHGYFLLSRAHWISNGFESIYHSEELYFRWKNLGQTDQGFVSPSGKYALYESVGKLLLKTNVTDGTFAVPESAVWHESEGYMTTTKTKTTDQALFRFPGSKTQK
jgi:hypothetical protein